MIFFEKLKKIIFPLDADLERAYWHHQLVAVSGPLKLGVIIVSILIWISVLTLTYLTGPNPLQSWYLVPIQLWLMMAYVGLNSVGKIRYFVFFSTPLFAASVTYFATVILIPSMRFTQEMQHAYPLLLMLVIMLYAFETVSIAVAVTSGLAVSLVLYSTKGKNLLLGTDRSVMFTIHIVLANIVGLIAHLQGRFISRAQFKITLDAQKDREVLDSLVKRVFPQSVVDQLKYKKKSNLARKYESTSIMFADIVNFTQLTTILEPRQLVTLLHELFSRFDRLAEQHGVEKIKTIGDAYMAAAGCPIRIDDHQTRIAFFSLELLKLLNSFNKQFQTNFNIRIGIHSGPVVGGVISGKRISFDIWGETVNLASRLQGIAEPGEIIVSDVVASLLTSQFVISEFKNIDLKGIGSKAVSRILSGPERNPYLQKFSKTDKQNFVSELPFLSEH